MKSLIKNKVVVLGVLYPGVEDYLDDYLVSLEKQSYMDYDLCIYNDGLDNNIFQIHADKHKRLRISEKSLNGNYTPAQIREIAIKDLKDDYDYLVLSDADDYFGSNRIEKSVIALNKYDFCYNDMVLVNSKSQKIGDDTFFTNKDNPKIVNDFNQLMSKNFCGLSNTSINLRSVDLDDLFIPQNLIAVDWWIFSFLSMKGCKGCFLDDVYTYYRQHQANTVGGESVINEESLQRGMDIKKAHYQSLLSYYPSRFDVIISKELDTILELEKRVLDKQYLDKYISTMNVVSKEYMWWENIRLI